VSYVLYFFSAILIWFSYRSWRGGAAYLRFFRKELSMPESTYRPFATIFAPCRGLDDGLEENLAALFEQEYPDFEIIFIVDDSADPAAAVIDKLIGHNNIPAKKIVAQRTENCSQKVANLCEGVLYADEHSEIFVFVDSDARPGSTWLHDLVMPLENEQIGAASAYRWFLPERSTFASELRSAWNASIASALGPNRRSNFCWGGSMAIRRVVFEKLQMLDKWKGTLSDDFAVTRTVKAAGLEIAFVPRAIAVSIDECGFSQMLEFTTRQMKITRTYAAPLWLTSFIGSALFCLVMIGSVANILIDRGTGLASILSGLTILLVIVCSVAKAVLRHHAISLSLPQHRTALAAQAKWQYTLWALAPPVFLFNCVSALFSRQIEWRGTRYELKSPNETVIIRG